MFISLHIPLNHIWHHWLLSCPGSPDRYPSASVQAILCSLAFRTQQGFVNASLLGAQKNTDKCFKASSTAPDSHDTEIPSKTEKSWRNLILSSAFPALSVHQLLWLLCPSAVAAVLNGLQSMTAIPDSLSSKTR